MELPGGRRPIENGPSEDERQYGWVGVVTAVSCCREAQRGTGLPPPPKPAPHQPTNANLTRRPEVGRFFQINSACLLPPMIYDLGGKSANRFLILAFVH